MQSSGKRLIFVLAVVFAFAAGRFFWLFSQSEPNRVQAQNTPLQAPFHRLPQKSLQLSLPSNCDQQKSVVARMGTFPVLQLTGKDIRSKQQTVVCQSRLILQQHGVVALTGMSPSDFSSLTGIAVPSARIAFQQILSRVQVRARQKDVPKPTVLKKHTASSMWNLAGRTTQLKGPITTNLSPSMLAAHVDSMGVTHLYEDYRPATSSTPTRLNKWVDRQRLGFHVQTAQLQQAKPSLRSSIEKFFSLPAVYAQSQPQSTATIPGWTLLEEVTLSWEDGYQDKFEVTAWILRQNENTVGDNYAVVTTYQTDLATTGKMEAMSANCANGDIPSNGFCGSQLLIRTIGYSASAATGILPPGNVGSIVSPQLSNPQPATQNFGCSDNVTIGTSQAFNVGVNSSEVVNAGATFGSSQSTAQGCGSDQVDTSITSQTSSGVAWQETFGDVYFQCVENYFNNNGDPRGLVSQCPSGPPPQATGNYTSVQGAVISFSQDTAGFGGIIQGTAVVDSGGTCSGSWYEENIDWAPGFGFCTDYSMPSSFQLTFGANAPEITVQACVQALSPTRKLITSQTCVPSGSTDPTTWWAGQSTSLALQTCSYLPNYNPVITINAFATIPAPGQTGSASGGQVYQANAGVGNSSTGPFSSQTNLAYGGATPSWTFTTGPGLQISQKPSTPDQVTGISTATAALTPPSNGYTPPNVSMTVNASPPGSAWTFDSATAPQGLAVNVSVQPWPTVTSVSPSSGQPGTPVTVVGTGFLDGASMCFADQCVPASSVNLLGTQITAPAPQVWGMDPVPVTVENSAGCLSQTSVSAGPFINIVKPCTGMLCNLCARFPELCSHLHPRYPIQNIWGLYMNGNRRWILLPLADFEKKMPLPHGPGPLSWVVVSDVNPVNMRQQHLNMSRGVLVQEVIAASKARTAALPVHTGDVIEVVDGYPVVNAEALNMVMQRPGHALQSQFRISRSGAERLVSVTTTP